MIDSIQPIKKMSVVELAIEAIYNLIKDHDLTVGDRLPAERDLADSLSISRSSLREALRVLDMMGIIRVEQGNGTVLGTAHMSKSIQKPLTFSLLLNKSKLIELNEVRIIIEVECAGLAAERATDEDIQALESLLSKLILNKKERELAINLEIELHNKIAKCAHNYILELILNPVKELLIESRKSTVPDVGVSDKTLDCHKRLIVAIGNQDAESARKIMKEHLSDLQERIKEINPE